MFRCNRYVPAIILAGGFFALPLSAYAQQGDIVNNLAQPSAGVGIIDTTDWEANSFKTNNASYLLASAALVLSGTKPRAGADPQVTVSLYSNGVGNQPGVLLANLGTSPILTSTPQTYIFMPASLPLMQPNSVYWLVASGVGADDWSFTNSQTYSGFGTIPTGFAIANTGNSGSTWNVGPLSDGPYLFQVTVPTPEPGVTAWLVSSGALGMYAGWRRRRRRQR